MQTQQNPEPEMGEQDHFVYSKAVVCSDVASSLPGAALRMAEPGQGVDLEKARLQHEKFTEVLRTLVKEIHVIPVDEKYPDCVFVEDPVFVCEDTAFLPILGHETRRGESVAMKKMMETLGLKIVEMEEPGRLDGGDVLFTGREIFVGQSKRTNESGLSQLAAAFPAYPVTGIPVRDCLHLKSFLTMAGPGYISISTSSAGRETKTLIQEKGHFKYRFYDIPDDIGSNCLYLNNTIIHVSQDEFPQACDSWERLDTPAKKIALSLSEMNKVDGCFTCSCVLIK